jgi:hypothetical protein
MCVRIAVCIETFVGDDGFSLAGHTQQHYCLVQSATCPAVMPKTTGKTDSLARR